MRIRDDITQSYWYKKMTSVQSRELRANNRYMEGFDPVEWVAFWEPEFEDIRVDGHLYLRRYFIDPLESTKDQYRLLLHQFFRGDDDRRPHNHPWDWAESLIISGGYTEDRVRAFTQNELVMDNPVYRTGDFHSLTGMDFHRIRDVQPNTWTLFRHGPRTHDWGFLEDTITYDGDHRIHTFRVRNYVRDGHHTQLQMKQ